MDLQITRPLKDKSIYFAINTLNFKTQGISVKPG